MSANSQEKILRLNLKNTKSSKRSNLKNISHLAMIQRKILQNLSNKEKTQKSRSDSSKVKKNQSSPQRISTLVSARSNTRAKVDVQIDDDGLSEDSEDDESKVVVSLQVIEVKSKPDIPFEATQLLQCPIFGGHRDRKARQLLPTHHRHRERLHSSE